MLAWSKQRTSYLTYGASALSIPATMLHILFRKEYLFSDFGRQSFLLYYYLTNSFDHHPQVTRNATLGFFFNATSFAVGLSRSGVLPFLPIPTSARFDVDLERFGILTLVRFDSKCLVFNLNSLISSTCPRHWDHEGNVAIDRTVTLQFF